MPDITYPIDSSGLASGYCPADWAALATAINATQSVTIPSVAGFVAQATAPADTGVIWIETSASIPYVRSVRRYEGGAWRMVPAPPTGVYFVDTGAANILTITTGETINNSGFLTGRIFVIRVNNANTGAVTLTVDSLGAKAVYKANTVALASGELAAGQLIMVGYDATSDVFELLTTLGTPPASAASRYDGTPVAITTGDGAITTVSTGLASIGSYNIRLVCQTGETGYSAGDEIDISAVVWDVGASDFNVGYVIQVTGGTINIIQPKDGDANNLGVLTHKTTGDAVDDTFTPANWKIRVTAYV